MRKILLIFIIGFIMVFLVACKENNNNLDNNQVFYDRIDQMWYREQKTLRVGMDLRYPPFETTDQNNFPEGISVDLARAFGAYIGRKVEIVNTNFSGLIPALEVNDIDIVIASMSITEARAEIVDFSNPYFYFKIISLVNKTFATANSLTEDSTIEDVLAIENAKYVGIATQVSTTIPQSYGKNVTEAIDLGTAIISVAQGTSDILLMSANPVVDGFKENRNSTMVIWDPFVASPIGMAVKKGNQTLLDLANEFILSLDEGGMYDILAAKWDEILLERLERYGLEFYISE